MAGTSGPSPPLHKYLMAETLKLSVGPVASQFIKAVALGLGDEILALGPRGEAKTISAAIATGYHAKMHEEAGFKLPVPWICATDTFNAHKEKTIPSLEKDFWQGAWRKEDGGHKLIFKTNKDAVVLSMFGIEDNTALDRVRKETACSWFEEVAPTTEGAGLPEEALIISGTSQRVATHAAVTMCTSNYPDDSHWLWTHFRPIIGMYGLNVHPDDPRVLTYQIPKGDNPFITNAQREKWLNMLKRIGRADLADRLLHGKPAVVNKGEAVAIAFFNDQPIGYNERRHLSPTRLPIAKNVPFILGQDGGHTPATTALQDVNGVLRVQFSLCIKQGGMRQQYKYNVIPWFRKFAPWVLEDPDEWILGCYDPSMPDDETDTERVDKNPKDVIQQELGGLWLPGPIDWESRKNALFGAFGRSVGGDPGIIIDPIHCDGLVRALRGQWYYPTDRFGNVQNDKPKSPNHPHEDHGQSLCYALCRVQAWESPEDDDDGMSQHQKDYDPMEDRN